MRDPEQELFFPESAAPYDPSADPLYQGFAPPKAKPKARAAGSHAPEPDGPYQRLRGENDDLMLDLASADAALAEEQGHEIGDASTLPSVQQPSALGVNAAYGDELHAEAQRLSDLLDTPYAYSSRDNPRFPIEQRRARAMLGDERERTLPAFDRQRALESFVPPDREEGESNEDYQLRVRSDLASHKLGVAAQESAYNMQAMDELDRKALRPEVDEYGTPGAPGLMEGQLIEAENVGNTSIEGQEKVLGVVERVAKEQGEAAAKIQKLDQKRRAHAASMLAATERMQSVEKEARAKLESFGDAPTAQSVFKGLSGGQKFWAILGSMAGGWNGSNDVPDLLMGMAESQLQAHKQNYAKAQDVLGSAQDAVDQSMDVYRTIADGVGNERAADLVWLDLQMEQGAKEIEQEIARTSIETERAKLREALVGIRAIQADNRAEREMILANTPQVITTKYDPLGPGERKRAEKRLGKIESEQFAVAGKTVDLVDKGEERAAASEAKRLDAERQAARGEGGYQAEARWFAKEAAPIISANAGLTSILNEYQGKDAPGRGFSAYFWSDEGRALREDIKESIRRQLRMETGAVIGPDELDDRFDSIYSGLGDDELLNNIGRLQKFNARAIQSIKAGISDDAAKFYDDNLFRRSGIGGQTQAVAGHNVDADAQALGGRVVR